MPNKFHVFCESFGDFFYTLDCYYFESNLNLVWHIGKECSVVLQSSKYEVLTFPHDFIFVFTPYIIGAILSRKVPEV